MKSLIFALEAVTPIILLVVIGYILKAIGLISSDLAKGMNKLVFRAFLPVTLFLNVYVIDSFDSIGIDFVLYAIIALVLIFLTALPVVCMITKDAKRRGALLQGSFRSNYALIGIPLAEALFGPAGTMVASVLLAISIPIFNTLAVVSLSIFKEDGRRVSPKKILVGIAKNPLIQGVAAGAVALAVRAIFVKCGIEFRLTDAEPIMKVLGYISSLSTPLALLVLGAQFEFSAIKSLRREIISGVIIRSFAVPAIGVGCAYLLFRDSFSGAHFAALVAMFSTPVAVSSVPMAQEMDSDAVLAGQLVIWTTITSAFTIFLVSFILSYIGIFPVA